MSSSAAFIPLAAWATSPTSSTRSSTLSEPRSSRVRRYTSTAGRRRGADVWLGYEVSMREPTGGRRHRRYGLRQRLSLGNDMLDVLDRDVAPSYPRVRLGDERFAKRCRTRPRGRA